MAQPIDLQFESRPSQVGLMLSALRNRKPRRRNPEQALAMRASWRGIRVDGAHLHAFQRACGLDAFERGAILYPLCYAYPPMLRMLSSRAAPMSLFDALNSRMRLRQHAPLAAGDAIDVGVRAVAARRLEKGAEVDLEAEVRRDGTTVWQGVMTFYYRGRFDGALDSPPEDALARPVTVGAGADWTIPAAGRFRFGHLCGDTNPLHYSRLFARALGFERDFAQPLLVLGQALNRIAAPPAPRGALELRLKAPVYYERRVRMLAAREAEGHRFDIYCEPNDKPSICGLLSERA
jgi:acyl dehydratase